MYPHRIRLRGPWECETLPRRITLPTTWAAALGDLTGTVRLRRRFGYPGQIDAHERVWLTFSGIIGSGTVHVNDVPLGILRDEIEITALLRPRNELVLEIAGGLFDEAALEVRASAYLAEVKVQREEGAIEVTGVVRGSAPNPLELYLVVDRHTTAYAVTETGTTFRLRGEVESPRDAKVELVNGAVIWYSWPLIIPEIGQRV